MTQVANITRFGLDDILGSEVVDFAVLDSNYRILGDNAMHLTLGNVVSGLQVLNPGAAGTSVLQAKVGAEAQPRLNLTVDGALSLGPGGATVTDTSVSRIARQNGHATDTPGILMSPRLEVAGPAVVVGLTNTGGFTQNGDLTIAGNEVFTGAGRRITGDMSNATYSQRLSFQTSTVDGATAVQVLPNGASQQAVLMVWNRPDPANAAYAAMAISNTAVQFISNTNGTGAGLPIQISTAGVPRLNIDTAGAITVGPNTNAPIIQPLPGAGNDVNLAITMAVGSPFISGASAVYLQANAYHDGTNWMRRNTAQTAMQLALQWNTFVIQSAPAGANPIAAWTQRMTIDPGNGNVLVLADLQIGRVSSYIHSNSPAGLSIIDIGASSYIGIQGSAGITLSSNMTADGTVITAGLQHSRIVLDTGYGGYCYVLETAAPNVVNPTVMLGVINNGQVILNGAQGGVWMGSNTPAVARITAIAQVHCMVAAPTGYVMVSSLSGTHLCGNCYWDGSNWLRYSTGAGAAYFVATSGALTASAVGAGANPIAWHNILNIDGNGNMSVYGSIGFPNGYSLSGQSGADINVNGNFTVLGGMVRFSGGVSYVQSDTNSMFLYTGTNGAIHIRATVGLYVQNQAAQWNNANAAAFVVQSTRKSKMDLVILDDALAMLMSDTLHGYRYTDIASGQARVGFVSDDWQALLPQVVIPTGDDLMLNYDAIGAVTFEAVKAMYRELQDLRQEVAALRAA